MSERTLLLRCALASHYFIVGMDFPSARVFDTNTSSLAAVLEVPRHGRASLAKLSLTSVALGIGSGPGVQDNDASTDMIDICYAAAGLSNGTVILHNVSQDESYGQVAVSEMQHPIVHMAFCGQYLFCLASNQMLYAVDVANGEAQVCAHVRTPPDSSAIAVARDEGDVPAKTVSNFRILVAGPTIALYTASLHANTIASGTGRVDRRNTVDKVVSFASQAAGMDYAWLGGSSGALEGSHAAVTACAMEGVIRIWDVRTDKDRTLAGNTARCRRTLLCGQRIANLSVLEGRRGAVVVATAFTGSVLLWDLGEMLLPRVVEPLPLPPTAAFVSDTPASRLLIGSILTCTRDTKGLDAVSLLLLRGSFALPLFEVINVGATLATHASAGGRAQQRHMAASAALSFGVSSAVQMVALPHSSELSEMHRRNVASGKRAGVENAFSVMDTVWANHRQQLAAKAVLTPTDAFAAAHTYHAPSIRDLPVKQLTLEQRLRQLHLSITKKLSIDNMGTGAGLPNGEEEPPMHQNGDHSRHSLGLATVPLYQALHANDTAAVMELLSIAARSPHDMRATVLSLQLPYCLQLLSMLAERLGICSKKAVKGVGESASTVMGGGLAAISTRSPLIAWIDSIVHYRGMEMYAAQRAAKDAARSATGEVDPSFVSPPKNFLGPILHQYRSMCNQYDKLATLYGRMSIFNSVRPSERKNFINRPHKMITSNIEIGYTSAAISSKLEANSVMNDILFPAMFAEVRTRRGPQAIRVRSRVAAEKKARERATSDRALLRRAKALAKEQLKSETKGPSILDGSDDDITDGAFMERIQADGGLDLDELEKMDLNDASTAESGDEEVSDEEDNDLDKHSDEHRTKKRRYDTVKDQMIAESDSLSDDDEDAQLDSSEAEFSAASDESDRSEVIDLNSNDEEEDTDSSSDEENDVAEAVADGEEGDDDDDSDDDGMGDDMGELLAAGNGKDHTVEQRRHKRRAFFGRSRKPDVRHLLEGHFWSLTRYRIGPRFLGLDYAGNVIFYPAYRKKTFGGWTAVTLGSPGVTPSGLLSADVSTVNVLEDGYPMHYKGSQRLQAYLSEERRKWLARCAKEAENQAAIQKNAAEAAAKAAAAATKGSVNDASGANDASQAMPNVEIPVNYVNGYDNEQQFRDMIAIKCSDSRFVSRKLCVNRLVTFLYKCFYFYLWALLLSLVVQGYLLFRDWVNPPSRASLRNIEGHVMHIPRTLFAVCVKGIAWLARASKPVLDPVVNTLSENFPQVNWSAASSESIASRAETLAKETHPSTMDDYRKMKVAKEQSAEERRTWWTQMLIGLLALFSILCVL